MSRPQYLCLSRIALIACGFKDGSKEVKSGDNKKETTQRAGKAGRAGAPYSPDGQAFCTTDLEERKLTSEVFHRK